MNCKFSFSETERSKDCIKVLAIGNSFSADATTYLRNMLLADEIDLRVGNASIGGCSLERHYGNISNGTKDYDFIYYTAENIFRINPVSLTRVLESNDWDFVTVQQVSGLSGKYETFNPFAKGLISYIKEKLPNAKLMLHMTWSYEENFAGIKANGYASQTDMYEKIKAAYSEFSKDYENAGIIPSGEAIQLARATFMGDTINRDGFHLNVKGRILAGYVWYEMFTGISPFESKYNPASDCEDLTENEIEAIKECAHKAVLNYKGQK